MRRAYPRVLAIALVTMLSSPARSAALHVAPVTLRLEVGQQAAGLTLTNMSARPIVAQVRVFGWSQDVSEDHLAVQQEVVASPPIVTIPAQGEQYVRVVRVDRALPRQELAYRLLIDELPAAPSTLLAEDGVNIRLRYSLPLFVAANGQTPATLAWELKWHDDAWFMRVINSGATHAQLSAVKLLQAGGKSVDLTAGLLGYALAGGVREWPLSVQSIAAGALKVAAVVNGQSIDAPLARSDGGAADRR